MTPKAKALGEQAAFPDQGKFHSSHSGMSTRTWLVGMAMQGLCTSNRYDGNAIARAENAIFIAEAQLEELAKDSETLSDTARLDWLERNQVTLLAWSQDDQDGNPTRKLWQCNNVGLEMARDSIRGAIDAAMQAGELAKEEEDKAVRHGIDCLKVPHDRVMAGYLHHADDDGPYDVDGCQYCGRCHCAL